MIATSVAGLNPQPMVEGFTTQRGHCPDDPDAA